MDVSVIIPCYNAIDKIGRCLQSLRSLGRVGPSHEVIFIDDCSTDGTYELLSQAATAYPDWKLLRTTRNSGSPSGPRNLGIDAARGKYIFFLDCDDEILPEALSKQYALACETDACIVRSELWVDNGHRRRLANRLTGWSSQLSKRERIEMIMRHQSTVVTSFVQTELLRRKLIYWKEQIRMGEDTLFLSSVLVHAERVEYLPLPTCVYYKVASLTPSSTAYYGRRELLDHLQVWSSTQRLLETVAIDYVKTRLNVGLKTVLQALIFRNRGDVDEPAFLRFKHFINRYLHVVETFKYPSRIAELLSCISSGSFDEFRSLSRPRLLIAGYDFQFIQDAIPELCSHFDIHIDDWSEQHIFDPAGATAHLEWAELIWCESLRLSQRYTSYKRPCQRLIVRPHDFTSAQSTGAQIELGSLDALVTDSVLGFEKFLEHYPNFERRKMRLIDKYVLPIPPKTDLHPERLYTLAIDGRCTSSKGLIRAVNILRNLRGHDSRFQLEIFSENPVAPNSGLCDETEAVFVNEVTDFINSTGLSSAVTFTRKSDPQPDLALRNIGYVLYLGGSLGEGTEASISNTFAVNSIPILEFDLGMEYIWPKEVIYGSDGEMVQAILRFSRDVELFRKACRAGQNCIQTHCNVATFTKRVRELFLELI